MGQFWNSISEVTKNYRSYDKWEQAQADERAKKEYLAEHTNVPKDKLDEIAAKSKAVVRAAEIMDARSEDNCENMEQFTSIIAEMAAAGVALAQMPLLLKFANNKKMSNIIQFASIGLVFLLGIVFILWGNSKQKDASRIGRYQAKRDNLQGVENFVTYTPEQIASAEEIARTIPNEKELNPIKKMFIELRKVFKDKEAYKTWLAQQDPNEIENLKKQELTPEQLQKGKENQELIVDTVKEINIKAEEYSENLENAFDTINMVSFLATVPAMWGLNKILDKGKVKNPVARKVISVFVPIMMVLSIASYGTIEQKKSARIGRYNARKELLANPARLLAFSEEDMKKAEDIKAGNQKLGFFKKIGQNFKFLLDYFKLKKEYNNYRKKEKQKNEKLQKALKEIKVTDAQKADAQELKENVFRAFDEIDEMSQRYSEDVEAGCEIARQAVNVGINIATLVSVLSFSYLLSKGKVPFTKIINGITKMAFKEGSAIRESVKAIYTASKGKNSNEVFAALSGKKDMELVFGEKTTLVAESITKLQECAKTLTDNIKNGENIYEALKAQIKEGLIPKYLSNLFFDIAKKLGKKRAKRCHIEISKDLSDKLKLEASYKNYKTLFNTVIGAFAPAMGIIIGVPFVMNSWLTNIQKKAGKIGIMKAMDNIDDPRVFAPQQVDSPEPTITTTISTSEQKETNLLKKHFTPQQSA